MSHFSVLVIGENPEEQLAPYHEFECTGVVDQYIQNVDVLEEARADYANATERRFKSPLGELLNTYENQFYREPTESELREMGSPAGSGFSSKISWSSRDWGDGRGYRAKIHFLPEGWEEVELKTSDITTLQEFIKEQYERPLLDGGEQPDLEGKHKWGWYRLDADGNVIELIRRTNPNKKWDCYRLGGRCSGFFLLKPNCTGTLASRTWDGPATDESRSADQARKGDIDFEAMREQAAKRAAERFDFAQSIVDGTPEHQTWEVIREGNSATEEIRKLYWEQPRCKAWNEAQKNDRSTFDRLIGWFSSPDEFLVSREIYIEKEADKALATFAVVKDSKWYERGEMGWWACVSNEKDAEIWVSIYQNLIKDLPDDTLLSVFDCHI